MSVTAVVCSDLQKEALVLKHVCLWICVTYNSMIEKETIFLFIQASL